MKIKVNKLYNFFIIFCLSGFLISSFLPSLFKVEGSIFNIIYRALILFISIIIIFKFFFKTKATITIKQYTLFFIFWLFYSLFLLKGVYFDFPRLAPSKNYSEYLQMAFGVVLIPCIGLILLDYRKLNFKLILNHIYYIIFALLLVSLILRQTNEVSGREVGEIEIGILIYGQYGTMLSLLSIYKMFKSKKKFYNLIYVLGFIIGTLVIFVSASRSPFIALIISIIYFFTIKKGTKAILYLSLPATVLTVFFVPIMSSFNNLFQSNFLDRLLSTFDTDNERKILYKVSVNEFLENPFFGESFVIQTSPYYGSYPHNLFIEGFMSTGIFIGSILIILFLKVIFIDARFTIQQDHSTGWIPLLFCQFFIFSMFSNNIYSNNLLWYLLILTIMSFKYEKYNYSTNNSLQ